MIANGAKKLRKGAAAVEFALVMPLFFMLILGIIEFGRAIMVEQIITNAAPRAPASPSFPELHTPPPRRKWQTTLSTGP